MMASLGNFETLGEIGGIGKSGNAQFGGRSKRGGAEPAFSIYLDAMRNTGKRNCNNAIIRNTAGAI